MTEETATTDEPTDEDARFDVPLRGVDVDSETRCVHYHTPKDVIATAFPCCETFYPCFECHAACCDHEAGRWPPERFCERAILCGVCTEVLTIEAYLASDHQCPNCDTPFNPGCENHREWYFAME